MPAVFCNLTARRGAPDNTFNPLPALPTRTDPISLLLLAFDQESALFHAKLSPPNNDEFGLPVTVDVANCCPVGGPVGRSGVKNDVFPQIAAATWRDIGGRR